MFSSLDWLPPFRWVRPLIGMPPEETGFQHVRNFNYLGYLTHIEETDINITIQSYSIPDGIIKRQCGTYMTKKTNKLRGLSPHATYTDRAAAAGRRS